MQCYKRGCQQAIAAALIFLVVPLYLKAAEAILNAGFRESSQDTPAERIYIPRGVRDFSGYRVGAQLC
jgi:hypothetical protein